MLPRCQDFDKLIPAAWDGDLGDADRKELERHLQQCPACRRRYAAGVAVARALAAIPPAAPPAGFATRVMADIRQRQAAARQRRRWYDVASGAATAAAAVIAVVSRKTFIQPALERAAVDAVKSALVALSNLATLGRTTAVVLKAVGKIVEAFLTTFSLLTEQGIATTWPWYVIAAGLLFAMSLKIITRRPAVTLSCS